MADLEGAQSQFLYEHRETCNQIAVVQVVVFVLSFIFTYSVWWSGLFGLLVAVVGYYGSLSPVVQSKVSFIQFYYFGNCFIFLLQILSCIVLIIIVNEAKVDGWGWAEMILGSICFFGQIYLTWQAIQKSHSYRTELMRNPPPTELMVYATETTSSAYTPLTQTDTKPM